MIKEFKGKNRFLSNFYPSPFVLGEKLYKTNEHYYQSQKAANKKDREIIRLAATPGKAKRLGRNVEIIDVWEETKDLVMTTGLKAKFDGNPGLRNLLLATGDQTLIEGNYWNDKYWGKCLKTNEGGNKLGRLLMNLRTFYKINKRGNS